MRLPSALLLLILGTACASVPPPEGHLSDRERAVLSALLRHETQTTTRPVLILDRTEHWTPDDKIFDPSPGTSEEEWTQMFPSRTFLAAMRSANRDVVRITDLTLPVNASMYPKTQFEREFKSERRFRRLASRLGGQEPLVLSVSRPALVDTHRWIVYLHSNATWSGCGGVTAFEVIDSGVTPTVKLLDVVGFW